MRRVISFGICCAYFILRLPVSPHAFAIATVGKPEQMVIVANNTKNRSPCRGNVIKLIAK